MLCKPWFYHCSSRLVGSFTCDLLKYLLLRRTVNAAAKGDIAAKPGDEVPVNKSRKCRSTRSSSHIPIYHSSHAVQGLIPSFVQHITHNAVQAKAPSSQRPRYARSQASPTHHLPHELLRNRTSCNTFPLTSADNISSPSPSTSPPLPCCCSTASKTGINLPVKPCTTPFRS